MMNGRIKPEQLGRDTGWLGVRGISREVQHRKCDLRRDDRLMRAEMEGQQNGVRGAVE